MTTTIGRRKFISALGGAAVAWPLAARAQNGRVRRIAVLMQLIEADPEAQARVGAFRDAVQKLGWSIGGNLQIDYRWGLSNNDKARAAMTELIKLHPDLIFANAIEPLRAAQQATQNMPIVFTTVVDPVGQGFVTSLAHPGGLTTGFSALEPSVGGKWVDLLKEIAPQISRVAFIFNPTAAPYGDRIASFVEQAAQHHSIEYVAAPVVDPNQFEQVMQTLSGGGFIACPDAFMATNRKQIIAIGNKHRLPGLWMPGSYAHEGGLIAYGPSFLEHFQQAASYIDRILKGDKPADLPVQEPSKFQLVINLKTAKTLSLTVSNAMQLLADEVIE